MQGLTIHDIKMIVLAMLCGYTVFVNISNVYKHWKKQAYILGNILTNLEAFISNILQESMVICHSFRSLKKMYVTTNYSSFKTNKAFIWPCSRWLTKADGSRWLQLGEVHMLQLKVQTNFVMEKYQIMVVEYIPINPLAIIYCYKDV